MTICRAHLCDAGKREAGAQAQASFTLSASPCSNCARFKKYISYGIQHA